MDRPLRLGSLFDGSGGFPLGGLLCGIEPVWASEIEPFPIRVTTKRFPWMKHLGDISQVNGAEIEPVDVVCFGSPCQNLSVAGRRDGLEGKQSSLFFQAIRIIKEMRAASNGIYPRWIVWENVPGAFSSNGGADFGQVLTEIARIAEPEAPAVLKADKASWNGAGLLLGDGWSVAYRVLDAQWWVPQRRKRIYLVCDFGSERAADILFEREGVCRDIAPGGLPWERTAGGAAPGAGRAVSVLNDQGGSRMDVSEDISGTLRSQEHGHQPIVIESAGFCTEHSAKARGIGFEEERSPTLRASAIPAAVMAVENHPADSRLKFSKDGLVQTLSSRMGTGGNNVPMVFSIGAYGSEGMLSPNPQAGIYEADTARALDANGGNPACNQGGMAVVFDGTQVTSKTNRSNPQPGAPCHTLASGSAGNSLLCAYGIGNGQPNQAVTAEQAGTLTCMHDAPAVCIDCRNHRAGDVSGTLQAKGNGGQSLNYINPVVSNYIVRRLTPRECAKLQGFPPDWCAGLGTPDPTEEDIAFWAGVFETHRRIMGSGTKPKSQNQIIKWLRDPHTDSAEYKLWGNGVALPCVVFVMQGIVGLYQETA
ncbi:MAG: DNA cytosine methyltransferase [Oscillospiraceae bacterium]|nr:DNA cytosine methyltransferase [Oscillospiraceae bacterium]